MNLYYFTFQEDTKKPYYTMSASFEEVLVKIRDLYADKEIYNIAQMGEVLE